MRPDEWGLQPERARELVSLEILAASLGQKDALIEAMHVAEQVWQQQVWQQQVWQQQKDARAAIGAQLVYRVFKATDLRPERARAFGKYLRGEAKNPLLAFWQEQSDTNP